MSRRHVSFLAIALVVVTAAILLLLPGQTGRDTLDADTAAVPGLEAAVNDLDELRVVGAGDTTIARLERGEAGWRVLELAGYPADLEVLRDVLGGLARARVIEPKTDNPAYYDRLGVQDVSDPEAGGLRLDLAGGERRWSVIVGDEAPARGGHYLRLADAAGSVLADFEGDVPADAAGWADATVVDLMAGEVAEVRITHPDGETVTARKVSADDTDFSLLERPEGRQTKSAWSVNSLGNALSTLDFEGVARAQDMTWDDAIAVRAVRFDGLVVEAQLLRDTPDGDWLRLEAAVVDSGTDDGDATNAVIDGPAGAASGEADPAQEAEADPAQEAQADPAQDAEAPARADADAINARAAGWAYRIPGFKADAMDVRVADLLREPEAGSDPGG